MLVLIDRLRWRLMNSRLSIQEQHASEHNILSKLPSMEFRFSISLGNLGMKLINFCQQ